MSKDYLLYEKLETMDQGMPIIFHKDSFSKRLGANHFDCHWHDKIELLYFIQGEAVIKCNSQEYKAKQGDLIVVNSNELHQGYGITETAEYYCIIFDTSLFQGRRVDICEAKYINPITQNNILFRNKVENDRDVARCINEFVREYESKEIGYEMAVKATIYQVLVILLRNHVQGVLSTKEYNARMKNLERFNTILEYVENNFKSRITIDDLCSMANLSRFHFCRVFKDITGKSLSEYLNMLRINFAESMLKQSDMNITEAAMACGFDDMNYFSRLFRKYKKVSPSSVARKRKGRTMSQKCFP